ncbi:MAG: alpha/beta fold hydrolase [Pseudomonadota bacterium]
MIGRAISGRVAAWSALLGALGLLAACAAGGPLPDGTAAEGTVPAGDAPAPREVALTLPAADGARLPTARWRPSGAPRAVILALHGYGDYGASTYSSAAESWAAGGIVTYAPDQRGFGRGETRGRWPGAEGLAEDAVAMSAFLRGRHPTLPLIVVGHSMGGGVALAAADPGRADGGLRADGLVLAAPAIWGGRKLNPFHRLAAWLAATVAPEKRFTGEGVVRIQASDNIEALRALSRDPYYLGRPSARELFGLVRVTDAAAGAAERVRLPTMLLLGAKDQIVPEARTAAVFERLPGGRGTIRYPDGWHLLFRDLNAVAVWRDVAGFAQAIALERRAGAGS